MAKSLLIVESPAKARTLRGYLGKDFRVEASVGHVKDLPKNELGVDVEKGFAPEYSVIRGKGKVLQQLKQAAQAVDTVYLAPDPDREGEAIAWHIAEEIRPRKGTKPVYRVLINEITKKGVQEALSRPREIDANRYNAQQARRILDRLVGYQISPLLWKKVRRGLSAGRVQSVALRLVVEREREIQAFRPEEYWTLDALLEGSKAPAFTARLRKIGGKTAKLSNRQEAEAARAEAAEQPFRLARVEKKEKRRHPAPPFITSTLQREAFRKLRFSAKKTMTVAQRLYEGIEVEGQPIGLITYMRTDSTRLSADAVEACREHIRQVYGPEFLPERPVAYRAKKGAQDAHEAIRPTSMDLPPERLRPHLDADQFRLYKLVWDRFVACQMKPALYDQTSVRRGGRSLPVPRHRVDPEVPRVHGGLRGGHRRPPRGRRGRRGGGQRPPRPPGRGGAATRGRPREPPGRPALHRAASPLHRVDPGEGTGGQGDREALDLRPDPLHPAGQGLREDGRSPLRADRLGGLGDGLPRARLSPGVRRGLHGPDGGGTRPGGGGDPPVAGRVEGLLWAVQGGARQGYRDPASSPEPTSISCDQCGKMMVIRLGRNGSFLACSGYPECRNTKEFERTGDGGVEVKEGEKTGEKCPECGADLVVRHGRFGRFVACSTYPECRHTSAVATGVACPKPGCGGEVVEKRSKKGKTFFGCNRFPTCDYALWDRPVPRPCPSCDHPFLVEKTGSRAGPLQCPRKGCGYRGTGEG